MSRFDVYECQLEHVDYFLDVQADLLSELNTRVVVPLVSLNFFPNEVSEKLRPVIEIQGKSYVLIITELAAIPTKNLRNKICNIEDDYRSIVTNSLDFLFQGF